MENLAFGKRPEERTIPELLETGIVIVDKPPGPTSHEVAAWVRKLLGAQKAGHAGTLDPGVSGVLPVALGRATRVLPFITAKEKEYAGIMRFSAKVPRHEVERLFAKFTGELEQMVPRMAAVRRRVRKRKVYNLNLIEYKEQRALFSVRCEAGTYVRVLCSDIGREVGGARMLELRRTAVGKIGEDQASRMQDVADAAWLLKRGDESAVRGIVKPVEHFLEMRKAVAKDSAVEAVCSGAALSVPGIAEIDEKIERGETVALMSAKGELVAIAQTMLSGSEVKKLQKGVAFKTLRVVMRKGTYPRTW